MNSYSLDKKTSTKTRRFLMLSAQATLMLFFAIGSTLSAQTLPLANQNIGPMQPPPANCNGDGTVGLGCGPDTPLIRPNIAGNGTSFTGVFPAYAGADYQGSFSGTGPYPGYSGTNHFDFTGLAAGYLPAGSILDLGDLDSGSGFESFTFTANGGGSGSAWLQSPFYMASQDPNDLYFSSMPSYKWDPSTSTYYFDGESVPGNPTVGVLLTAYQNLYTLD